MSDYKIYASEQFVEENYIAQNQGTQNYGGLLGVNIDGKAIPLKFLESVIFKDNTTGFNWIGYVDNGEWTLSAKVSEIKVKQLPNRIFYNTGDLVDLNGLIIEVIFSDGTTTETTDYMCNLDIINNETNIPVLYKQGGLIYTSSFDIINYTIELIDFNYTINDNGTYIITDWKGTYKGEPSSKCVIPNIENIIVNLE